MPHSAAVSIATSTLSGGTGHGVAEAGAAVVGAATAGALASTSGGGGGGLVVAFETEVWLLWRYWNVVQTCVSEHIKHFHLCMSHTCHLLCHIIKLHSYLVFVEILIKLKGQILGFRVCIGSMNGFKKITVKRDSTRST